MSLAALKHADIWRAIDRLAELHGMSASGLAKKAGLSPTLFNPSKRSGPKRKRWPSTESIAAILRATGTSFADFVALAEGSETAASGEPVVATNASEIVIGVRGLEVEAIIGTKPGERLKPQPLSISVSATISPDCDDAVDDIIATVNYSGLADIARKAAAREFRLLESLAREIADKSFAFDARISALEVEIRKPQAVKGAECAFVRIKERKP